MSELDALRSRLGRLADLGSLGALASWDQQCKMPARGAEGRADMIATLTGIAHELLVDDETGRLLQDASAELERSDGHDPDSDDARLIAVARRQYEKARRVPSELAAEMAGAFSAGQDAWVGARAASDMAAFVPYLQRNVDLTRSYVDCHMSAGAYETAYDVLLDNFEPRMRTADVARLFAELSDQLVPLIGHLAEAPPIDDGLLRTRMPVSGQRELVAGVIAMMGFDEAGWRLDDTVHPFATRIGVGDVRVTTRWEDSWWPTSLFGAMHEVGHGLYEDGVDPRLRRTPIGSPESLSLHESQSRLWENMVGRGRPFAEVLAPRVGDAFGDGTRTTPDALFSAVNRVKPTFIRIEADEATYALHIILRFELEQQLIDGTLAVTDAAEAWRERFRELLGLTITDDADGILQDVHWSAGLIGYFPTYALGNLIAGQLWQRVGAELPDRDEKIAAGELGELREWLRAHVHRHGSKFATTELLEREAGGPMTVDPFMGYLKAKLGEVYSTDLTDATHMKVSDG